MRIGFGLSVLVLLGSVRLLRSIALVFNRSAYGGFFVFRIFQE